MSAVTDTSRNGVDTEKLTIRVAAKTSLPLERVLDLRTIFPNDAPTCGQT